MEALLTPEVFAWFVPALSLLLALLCAGFILRFMLPALLLGWELRVAIRRLKAIKAKVPASPEQIAREAMNTRRLAHLWREFAQTLHAERVETASGKDAATPQRWRATALAETFFTEHALVDTPLKTEFYKHLPGILTGIGILGTFTGLIGGLSQFAVTADANAVRNSLGVLIHSVGHAFQISAAAIGLAMLFTWIEKSLVTARYRQVAELVQLIDSLFESGAGEEYLARLVRASEVSARQSETLRDALVSALRESMREQHEASKQEQQKLAVAISRTVGESLRDPMSRLAGAIEHLGNNQSQTVGAHIGETLAKALTQFSARMDERYGKEMAALQAAQCQAQAESSALLRDAGANIRALAEEMRRAGASTQNNVAQIADSGRGTAQAFAGSAQMLNATASELGAASRSIGNTALLLNQSGTQIAEAISGLATASAMTRETLAAQGDTQQGFTALLLELRQTIEQARREASLNNDLVSRLEASAGKLGQAERQAESYLQGINTVLGEAHAAFARNVEKTLREGNHQFQRELAEAVEHLRTGIDDLGDVLDSVVTRR